MAILSTSITRLCDGLQLSASVDDGQLTPKQKNEGALSYDHQFADARGKCSIIERIFVRPFFVPKIFHCLFPCKWKIGVCN